MSISGESEHCFSGLGVWFDGAVTVLLGTASACIQKNIALLMRSGFVVSKDRMSHFPNVSTPPLCVTHAERREALEA